MNVEGIILAAGFSKRAGTFKMALEFNNKTIIENCVETMHAFCSKVYVVTGYKSYIIEKILKDKYNNVFIVNNTSYEEGMFTSVREGIRHIGGDKFFITPGDYPDIRKSTYEKLLEASSSNKKQATEIIEEIVPVIVPEFNGRRGHPILIDSIYKDEILNEKAYKSLRDFVNNKGVKLVQVEDSGILMDVDTLEDYNMILNQKKNKLLE